MDLFKKFKDYTRKVNEIEYSISNNKKEFIEIYGSVGVYRMGCIVADASVAKYYDGWPCAEACGYLGGRASSFQAGE